MMAQVQKEPRKFLVSFCCLKPSRPHAIVCAILWTIFVSLCGVGCLMMYVEVNDRADLINKDYMEEIRKRRRLQNGSVVLAPNEVKLFRNYVKTNAMASSVYQMFETATLNFFGAILSLYAIISSRPVFSIPFIFSSFYTIITATFLYGVSGYWRELMQLPKEKLMYFSCISSILGVLMLTIWIPLLVYNLDQLKKLHRDAGRMNPSSVRAFGGMTHTIKPIESSDEIDID